MPDNSGRLRDSQGRLMPQAAIVAPRTEAPQRREPAEISQSAPPETEFPDMSVDAEIARLKSELQLSEKDFILAELKQKKAERERYLQERLDAERMSRVGDQNMRDILDAQPKKEVFLRIEPHHEAVLQGGRHAVYEAVMVNCVFYHVRRGVPCRVPESVRDILVQSGMIDPLDEREMRMRIAPNPQRERGMGNRDDGPLDIEGTYSNVASQAVTERKSNAAPERRA